MPRMMMSLRPGMALTSVTLGKAPATSSRDWKACLAMSSVESAVTLCATSCRFASRRVAVTMTGSSLPAAGSSWAIAAWAGFSTAQIAAVSGIFRFVIATLTLERLCVIAATLERAYSKPRSGRKASLAFCQSGLSSCLSRDDCRMAQPMFCIARACIGPLRCDVSDILNAAA